MFCINQTLIKSMIHNGTLINYCPNFVLRTHILRTDIMPTSENMTYGKFFESLAIGGTAHGGDLVLDLKRKKVTKAQLRKNPNAKGEKTVTQIRIEEQVEVFKKKAEKYGILYDDKNTQIKIYKRWHENPNVILCGELDIFPTIIKLPDIDNENIKISKGTYLAIIDLKMTGNIENDYGPFSWGNFKEIDKIQAQHYSYLIRNIDFDLNDKLNPGNNLRELFSTIVQKFINEDNFVFIYWVFDHKPKYNDIFHPFKMDTMKWNHYYETIRKTIANLEFEHKRKFPCAPELFLCKSCHIKNCEYYNLQFT